VRTQRWRRLTPALDGEERKKWKKYLEKSATLVPNHKWKTRGTVRTGPQQDRVREGSVKRKATGELKVVIQFEFRNYREGGKAKNKKEWALRKKN